MIPTTVTMCIHSHTRIVRLSNAKRRRAKTLKPTTPTKTQPNHRHLNQTNANAKSPTMTMMMMTMTVMMTMMITMMCLLLNQNHHQLQLPTRPPPPPLPPSESRGNDRLLLATNEHIRTPLRRAVPQRNPVHQQSMAAKRNVVVAQPAPKQQHQLLLHQLRVPNQRHHLKLIFLV